MILWYYGDIIYMHIDNFREIIDWFMCNLFAKEAFIHEKINLKTIVRHPLRSPANSGAAGYGLRIRKHMGSRKRRV